MTEKKNFADAFVNGRKEIVLNYNGTDVTFYANELGFLANQHIAIQAGSEGKNGLALLVAESITDSDGNKFTYNEITKLKREFAEPLFTAVVELHKFGEEKN